MFPTITIIKITITVNMFPTITIIKITITILIGSRMGSVGLRAFLITMNTIIMIKSIVIVLMIEILMYKIAIITSRKFFAQQEPRRDTIWIRTEWADQFLSTVFKEEPSTILLLVNEQNFYEDVTEVNGLNFIGHISSTNRNISRLFWKSFIGVLMYSRCHNISFYH